MARLARKPDRLLGKNCASNLELLCRFGGASTFEELCRVLDSGPTCIASRLSAIWLDESPTLPQE
jgi:hypothetical protein